MSCPTDELTGNLMTPKCASRQISGSSEECVLHSLNQKSGPGSISKQAAFDNESPLSVGPTIDLIPFSCRRQCFLV
jgi:hypothetical protein